MAFLGDALAHAMIAGVAGGYLFMKILFDAEAHATAMLVGSVLAAILTVGLIGFVSRVSRVKEDTAIGIMYTGVFAGGVVLVSVFSNYIHIDLMHFIMGDVLAVADSDLWVAAAVTALVLAVMILFFRAFQLTSFDPVMAASIGLPVVLIDYVLTTCVSLVVVSAVSMVGVILVVGLLIAPAASAYLLCDRLSRMMAVAALFGVTSVVAGLYLCVWLDSSGGGAIVLFCTFQFLAVLVAAPRYGVLARRLRLRRMVPQQLAEDILVAVVRSEGAPVSVSEIESRVQSDGRPGKAVKRLAEQGLLRVDDSGVTLTDAGEEEAQRVLRAHRLWEAYLAHVGTPGEEIHPRAHRLEHVSDPEAMGYLDDLLDHPVRDPHGKEIPEDPCFRQPGCTAPLSLLREGRACVVERVNAAAEDTGLRPGDRIRVGPRRNGGRIWTVIDSDSQEKELSHTAADAVVVRCP
jgi:manganese/iron transport system permease protein/iron/zinc/copper transport system permease protein